MELKNGDHWYYTYFLRSLMHPTRTYIGSTEKSPYQRLEEHNSGDSAYTSRHRPWQLIVFTAFNNRKQAEAFEIYLKNGSGQRFAQNHFFNL